MSYVSFYRKWRPQTFSEIIGQEYIVQTLQNAISKKRISHSYIFCGPRGTGKTSLARIFAKGLNCVNGPTSRPCNKCENCTSISAGTNIDVVEIDAASNRGIGEIRDLREKVKYLPVKLRKKVYIIDEVHMLTNEAFNALLKVLEEPPEHVLFIMATTEPHQVIQTIMSRCQRFDFEPVPVEKIRQRISSIALSENITINESALNLIARYADGSLRDADGILEQLSSLGDSKITVDDVTSLLGIIDQEMLFEFANILLERNLGQALLFIKRIISSNLNLKIFTAEFLEHLYSLYVIKNYENPLDILDISEDYRNSFFNQAGLFKQEELEFLMDLFSDLLRQIRWSENARSFFKTSIIKAITHENADISQFSKKLREIETEIRNIKEKIISGAEALDYAKPFSSKENAIASKQEQEVGTIKEDLHSEDKESKKVKAEISKPQKDPGGYESLISDRWDELQLNLKSKKRALQAMFAEVRSFKIISNKIIFYLDNNKNWHKDHLSIQANIEIVRSIIKDLTGKNFTVFFELLSEDDNGAESTQEPSQSNNININNSDIHSENMAAAPVNMAAASKNMMAAPVNITTASENEHETDDNIFEYFEEKFHIKEK